jgi:hypothetical protein
MSNQRSAICTSLELKWYTTIELLETLKELPKRLLGLIKKLYAALKTYIKDSVMNQIYSMIDFIKRMLTSRYSNQPANELCALMYSCEAAFKMLSELLLKNYGDSDNIQKVVKGFRSSGFKDNITGITFATGYDAFEFYACRLSLKSLINSKVDEIAEKYIKSVEAFLTIIIANLDASLTGNVYAVWIKTKIAMAMKAYEASIQPIIDTMHDLNDFVKCGLGVCDFASSAKNLQDELSSMFIISQGGDDTWSFDNKKADAKFKSSVDGGISDLKLQLDKIKSLVAVYKESGEDKTEIKEDAQMIYNDLMDRPNTSEGLA